MIEYRSMKDHAEFALHKMQELFSVPFFLLKFWLSRFFFVFDSQQKGAYFQASYRLGCLGAKAVARHRVLRGRRGRSGSWTSGWTCPPQHIAAIAAMERKRDKKKNVKRCFLFLNSKMRKNKARKQNKNILLIYLLAKCVNCRTC